MKLRKVIVVPDSYKGVMSAKQVADIIACEVTSIYPNCVVVKMPIADGGEGSVETIISAVGGKLYETKVLSPDGRLITASFAIAADGTAILEMAQSSGLTKQNGLNPMTANTYGFGQLILTALEYGAREFILCIGGSATTDGGGGMASALGVQFHDNEGNRFIPCGATLSEIADIDVRGIDGRIPESKFTVMCDVENPLFGENGAAYVYAPQKGASFEQVLALDKGLRHLRAILLDRFGADYSNNPGAGAAGGLGAGCMAFLNADLVRGSDAILNLCGFEDHLPDTDLIITGEGKLDAQSFSGKVLSGILSRAGGVQVCSICGVCECEKYIIDENNIDVFEVSEGISKEESMENTAKYLRIATERAMRMYSQ